MKAFYHVLGGLLLIAGIGWAVYIVVAVATQAEGFTRLTDMIGPLVFHVVSMFLGAVFTSLGLRKQQSAV